MNSKTLRRLAADHGALHSQPLPPNYLFAPHAPPTDDLTSLDILLAGPAHTPFAAGVFKLHLTLPSNYPLQPPTAYFRTPIFHPNVDPQTGGVCVETLKRDWDAKLTIRDILVVIGCLLIQPNPDSALNAEAGGLIREDYKAFERRAGLMTSIHAGVPRDLKEVVREAQERGQEREEEELEAVEEKTEVRDFAAVSGEGRRRKAVTARQRGTTTRKAQISPSGSGAAGRRGQPFVLRTASDEEDPFAAPAPPQSTRHGARTISSVSSTTTPNAADQENAALGQQPSLSTPLNDIQMSDLPSSSNPSPSTSDLEPEYPPSPAKSPRKQSPRKTRQGPQTSRDPPRRDAAPATVTPPSNLFPQPLALDSPFGPPTAEPSPSPRKTRRNRPITPPARTTRSAKAGEKRGGRGGGGGGNLFTPVRNFDSNAHKGGITKHRSPSSSSDLKAAETQPREASAKDKKAQLEAQLWELCGRDIGRWNRGDFGQGVYEGRAARW